MPQSLAGIRILVVEDDDDSREILAQVLILEGATVTAVSTARQALALLSKADIVLTDVAIAPNHPRFSSLPTVGAPC
jgi:CheY-like chemotaxis protein